jgi:hypothetical protein
MENVLKLQDINVIKNTDKQTALVTKEWIIALSLIALYHKQKNVIKEMN